VVSAATEWLPKWKANNFRTAANTKVKNLDLITAIDRELQERSGPVYWVRQTLRGKAAIRSDRAAFQLTSQNCLLLESGGYASSGTCPATPAWKGTRWRTS